MDGIQFTSLPEEIFQGPINLIHLSLDYTVRVDLDCESLCSLKTRPSSNLCFGKPILDYCSLPYCFPSNYSNHSALEATGSGVGRKYNNITQYRVSWSCPAGEYATNRFTYCSQTNSTLTGAIDCKALNCSDDVPAISNGHITSDDHGLQVTCNTGYEVIGPAKVVCQGTSHRSPPGRCYDQNECNDETHLCKGNEQCSNTVASYTCHCSSGWTGDAGSCPDIDECISQHKCNLTTTTCKNTNGSYTCQCREGHIQVFPWLAATMMNVVLETISVTYDQHVSIHKVHTCVSAKRAGPEMVDIAQQKLVYAISLALPLQLLVVRCCL